MTGSGTKVKKDLRSGCIETRWRKEDKRVGNGSKLDGRKEDDAN
jgi:hypothetical protein